MPSMATMKSPNAPKTKITYKETNIKNHSDQGSTREFVFIHEYITTMDINAAIKNTTYQHILIYGCTGP